MTLKPIQVLRKKSNQIFFYLPLESNSITAHGYAKVSLLKVYITAHKMGLSESFVYLKPVSALAYEARSLHLE